MLSFTSKSPNTARFRSSTQQFIGVVSLAESDRHFLIRWSVEFPLSILLHRTVEVGKFQQLLPCQTICIITRIKRFDVVEMCLFMSRWVGSVKETVYCKTHVVSMFRRSHGQPNFLFQLFVVIRAQGPTLVSVFTKSCALHLVSTKETSLRVVLEGTVRVLLYRVVKQKRVLVRINIIVLLTSLLAHCRVFGFRICKNWCH